MTSSASMALAAFSSSPLLLVPVLSLAAQLVPFIELAGVKDVFAKSLGTDNAHEHR